MSYEAVILDNYLEAIESEKKGDLYNAAKYYKWQVKLSIMQMFQTGVEK